MNDAPQRQSENRIDRIESRLRNDVPKVTREAPSGLRSRVMREVIASGKSAPVRTSAWHRGPVLGAAGLALAASVVVLVGTALVQPIQQPMQQVPPAETVMPDGSDGSSTLTMLRNASETAWDAPDRILETTLSGEVARLRLDADRVSASLNAVWKPIRAILASQ